MQILNSIVAKQEIAQGETLCEIPFCTNLKEVESTDFKISLRCEISEEEERFYHFSHSKDQESYDSAYFSHSCGNNCELRFVRRMSVLKKLLTPFALVTILFKNLWTSSPPITSHPKRRWPLISWILDPKFVYFRQIKSLNPKYDIAWVVLVTANLLYVTKENFRVLNLSSGKKFNI